LSNEALRLTYQSITGPREVQIVPSRQMGRIRYQVLANDIRLEFAGSFFDTPRKAMEEVERSLRRRYGGDQPIAWVLAGGSADRPISLQQVGDHWPS
jgi:hypothetical protein